MDDNLTKNPHTWQKISNLLFIESPAGVGFSYNTNESFNYNDSTTATDNMNALLDFFVLYPEYKNNRFWLAG
jgi:carboxypeptidase C (cathepsin A)